MFMQSNTMIRQWHSLSGRARLGTIDQHRDRGGAGHLIQYRDGNGAAHCIRSWRLLPPVNLVICLSVLLALPASPTRGDEPAQQPGKQKEPDDLTQRLIRESVTASDEDLMDRILRLMGSSAHRLEIDFDAGDETQAVQQRIAKELDDAIKLSASRMRKVSQNLPEANSDERRHQRDPSTPRQRKMDVGKKNGDNNPPDATTESTGVAEPDSRPDTPFRESRRGWGHLPRRQREEVLQGIGEQSLERYREWIDRYYRALQEAEE